METSNARKLRWKDMRDVLLKLSKKAEREQITVSTSLITYLLEEWKGINVTRWTVRENGFCKNGKWDMKYQSANYRSKGDPDRRGLVIKTQEFIEEVES